jgi:sirohydrochlorin ferrochelatase
MPQTSSKLAILLVDHGSRRAEANACLEEIAQLVQARVGADVFVCHAHMELAEPDIAHALQACADANITDLVVHPYMLTPGRHAREDIPRLVAQAAYPGLRTRVTEPLGVHPALAEAVLDRCGVLV